MTMETWALNRQSSICNRQFFLKGDLSVLKRLFLVIGVTAVFFTGIASAQEKRLPTADRHKALKIACAGCHNEEQPKTAAPEDACLKCHTSIESVADLTKSLK